MQKNNKQNKTKKNSYNTKKRNGGRGVTSNYRLQTGRTQQMALPESEIVDMPWTDDGLAISSPLATYMSWRYKISSPYDPNPNVGGTSALYFVNWAVFYRRYRALTARIDMEFVNNENFPVFITGAPTGFDINSTITSNINAANVGELPFSMKPRLLAAKGGQDRFRMSKTVHFPSFIGNKQAWFADDRYSALNNTDPANPMFFQIAAFGTGLLTLGITAYIRITFRTLWSEFNYSTTLFKSHLEMPIAPPMMTNCIEVKEDDLYQKYLKDLQSQPRGPPILRSEFEKVLALVANSS